MYIIIHSLHNAMVSPVKVKSPKMSLARSYENR